MFSLQFKVKLHTDDIPDECLKLNGDVMDEICQTTKELILHETDSVSENTIKVKREKCKVKHKHDKYLRVKLTVHPRNLQSEAEYEDPVSSTSKELWENLCTQMKAQLKYILGFDVDILLEQWTIRSITIKVDLL